MGFRSEASANDVDKAVKAAQKALKVNGQIYYKRKSEIFRNWKQTEENAELLGKVETLIQVNFLEKHINRQII